MTIKPHDEHFLNSVICPANDRIEFLLHGLRERMSPVLSVHVVEKEAGLMVFGSPTLFENADVAIDFFTLQCPQMPANLEETLSTWLLDFCHQGAFLSWLTFEFVSADPNVLCGLWGGQKVFGFAVANERPKLALTLATQQSLYWNSGVDQALGRTLQRFPSLKNCQNPSFLEQQ